MSTATVQQLGQYLPSWLALVQRGLFPHQTSWLRIEGSHDWDDHSGGKGPQGVGRVVQHGAALGWALKVQRRRTWKSLANRAVISCLGSWKS
ncbi:MAG: hypothetical protein K9N47_22985 [Prosthecobacter sp.]|uniref:hypothetical protein n=1 Tax=Prosthecobacter sp. TaxID=1965333 RepID=UPI00262704C4|nr:hypothetical protein [Prosthecobacter sp.]MCF7789009.1 hypothetical protein [Prosthecobacter sp.]